MPASVAIPLNSLPAVPAAQHLKLRVARSAGGESVYRQAVRRAIKPEQLQLVVEKLRDLALAGDPTSAKLILEYTVGKPLPVSKQADLVEQEMQRRGQEELRNLSDEELLTYQRLRARVLGDNAGDDMEVQECPSQPLQVTQQATGQSLPSQPTTDPDDED